MSIGLNLSMFWWREVHIDAYHFTTSCEQGLPLQSCGPKNVVMEDEWTPAYLPRRRQTTCFTRTCDQVITGRNLNYNRVLEIVQNEEYLSAADIGQIRKTGRVESRGRRIKRQVITTAGIRGRLCNGDGTDISGFVCGAEGDICSPDLTPFPDANNPTVPNPDPPNPIYGCCDGLQCDSATCWNGPTFSCRVPGKIQTF